MFSILFQTEGHLKYQNILNAVLGLLLFKREGVRTKICKCTALDARTTLMHSKYGMRHVCAYMDYITVEINDVDKMMGNMISSDLDLKRLCYGAGPAPGSDESLVKSRARREPLSLSSVDELFAVCDILKVEGSAAFHKNIKIFSKKMC